MNLIQTNNLPKKAQDSINKDLGQEDYIHIYDLELISSKVLNHNADKKTILHEIKTTINNNSYYLYMMSNYSLLRESFSFTHKNFNKMNSIEEIIEFSNKNQYKVNDYYQQVNEEFSKIPEIFKSKSENLSLGTFSFIQKNLETYLDSKTTKSIFKLVFNTDIPSGKDLSVKRKMAQKITYIDLILEVDSLNYDILIRKRLENNDFKIFLYKDSNIVNDLDTNWFLYSAYDIEKLCPLILEESIMVNNSPKKLLPVNPISIFNNIMLDFIDLKPISWKNKDIDDLTPLLETYFFNFKKKNDLLDEASKILNTIKDPTAHTVCSKNLTKAKDLMMGFDKDLKSFQMHYDYKSQEYTTNLLDKEVETLWK